MSGRLTQIVHQTLKSFAHNYHCAINAVERGRTDNSALSFLDRLNLSEGYLLGFQDFYKRHKQTIGVGENERRDTSVDSAR
jgi:hypothetical protein